MASGVEVATLSGHKNNIECVAFSFDGTRFAAVVKNNKIKLWDVANGKEITSRSGIMYKIERVDFAPDGTRPATRLSYKTFTTWDVA